MSIDISSESFSGDSGCETSDADASQSESGTSDSGSVTGETEVSDWLQVTSSVPGQSTAIPVQSIVPNTVVLSSFV
jgi:hypothetical protein